MVSIVESKRNTINHARLTRMMKLQWCQGCNYQYCVFSQIITCVDCANSGKSECFPVYSTKGQGQKDRHRSSITINTVQTAWMLVKFTTRVQEQTSSEISPAGSSALSRSSAKMMTRRVCRFSAFVYRRRILLRVAY